MGVFWHALHTEIISALALTKGKAPLHQKGALPVLFITIQKFDFFKWELRLDDA